MYDVEHFACYVVDSFLSNVENADVPCCTQHRGAGTQEAGRAALQAQAGAGSYATKYRTKKAATTPKSSKTGPASLHAQQLRCAGTPALSREASPGTLGDKANPRTVAPSTPRWQTHKTGSFVIQIFSRHCAVQKTKRPRHVDTPALHREAPPWDPR